MVGGPVFIAIPEFVALVGADATAIDGQQAALQAERMLSLDGPLGLSGMAVSGGRTALSAVKEIALVKAFKAPKTSLGDLDAEAAAILITAAADIAHDRRCSGRGPRRRLQQRRAWLEELAGQDSWLGKPWTDTVTPDSRAKVESLLADADAAAGPQWRHVNLLSARGASVPILFSAVRDR